MASFIPELLSKSRKGTTFDILRGYDNHGHLTSPSGTAFLAGTMLDLDAEGRVTIAASGKGQWFALQTVEDLSGKNGYRNLNNTNAGLGEVIGCQYGTGMASTAIHNGVGSPGYVGVWNGSTMVFVSPTAFDASVNGKAVCVLEGPDTGGLVDSDATLTGAGATAGTYSAASTVKAIIRFSIPLA